MHEKLKNFLETKKANEKKKSDEQKQKTLIELGLYDKIYSPDNKSSSEFPLSEWDYNNSTTKFYKKVPIDVTDEEYEEIKKYSTNKTLSENNSIATFLNVIACILFVGGFFAGFLFGTIEVEKGYYYTYTDTEFSITIAFICWFISFISGTVFLGFSEIIKLLNDIKRK